MRLLTLAVVVLAFAPSANARSRPHRMTFEFASAVAVDYWAKRDVIVPCPPKQHLLTDAETADWGYTPDMLADVPACSVDVTPWADSWRTDPDIDWYYCREVVHEVGHLAGLEHDYGGVMNPEQNIVPWGCDHPQHFLRARERKAARLRSVSRALRGNGESRRVAHLDRRCRSRARTGHCVRT